MFFNLRGLRQFEKKNGERALNYYFSKYGLSVSTFLSPGVGEVLAVYDGPNLTGYLVLILQEDAEGTNLFFDSTENRLDLGVGLRGLRGHYDDGQRHYGRFRWL